MTHYALHSDRRLVSPLSIPTDHATNNHYAWHAFDSAERCAQFVAISTAHRVAVAPNAVPPHVKESAHARPLPPTGHVDTRRGTTCHNAQHGSFNHECGNPAAYIGTRADGYTSAFCTHCAAHGDERHGYTMEALA